MIWAFIIILSMAILARESGGGFIKLPHRLDFLPEVFFGAAFGLAYWHLNGGFAMPMACAIWSFAWMETGHGTALHMGSNPVVALSGRKQFLSPVVDRICLAAGWQLGGWQYCWLLFGIKGALIGLPVAPYGLLLSFLWPASYQVGHWLRRGDVKELLSGACAGFVIWLVL